MLVDCGTCPVRDLHCAECIVSTLMTLPTPSAGPAPGLQYLDEAEQAAVSILLGVGLISAEQAESACAEVEPFVPERHRDSRRPTPARPGVGWGRAAG